jgi:hypothetical protein
MGCGCSTDGKILNARTNTSINPESFGKIQKGATDLPSTDRKDIMPQQSSRANILQEDPVQVGKIQEEEIHESSESVKFDASPSMEQDKREQPRDIANSTINDMKASGIGTTQTKAKTVFSGTIVMNKSQTANSNNMVSVAVRSSKKPPTGSNASIFSGRNNGNKEYKTHIQQADFKEDARLFYGGEIKEGRESNSDKSKSNNLEIDRFGDTKNNVVSKFSRHQKQAVATVFIPPADPNQFSIPYAKKQKTVYEQLKPDENKLEPTLNTRYAHNEKVGQGQVEGQKVQTNLTPESDKPVESSQGANSKTGNNLSEAVRRRFLNRQTVDSQQFREAFMKDPRPPSNSDDESYISNNRSSSFNESVRAS